MCHAQRNAVLCQTQAWKHCENCLFSNDICAPSKSPFMLIHWALNSPNRWFLDLLNLIPAFFEPLWAFRITLLIANTIKATVSKSHLTASTCPHFKHTVSSVLYFCLSESVSNSNQHLKTFVLNFGYDIHWNFCPWILDFNSIFWFKLFLLSLQQQAQLNEDWQTLSFLWVFN